MKDFHHSYICRPTENAKKEQKTTRSHHCNMCKCVKLHYHDCPMIMHPCPLHGSPFHSEETIQKADRGQNVIISFHPSSRTERLLQPIKSLLANCRSETKINFQYYSPPNSISSESVRPNYGQNALEQLKRNLNNNIFIDRTKSFVADKTNKVKKLKECFYSPCDSVARKSRSQTSIKDKLNQALFDDHKDTQNALFKIMSEVPPNDLRNDWFSPRKLSNEKFQSDFVTVTKHDKNNIINHKIFEIKHDTEEDEIPYVGFPKPQNQFVYAATSVSEEPQKRKKFQFCKKKRKLTKDASTGPEMQKNQKPKEPETPVPVAQVVEKEKVKEKEKEKEIITTERETRSEMTCAAESSSSGSVYITPFFLVPGNGDDNERRRSSDISDISRPLSRNEKAVQVGEPFGSPSAKSTQTSEKRSEVVFKTQPPSDPKVKTVILQTECYTPVSSRQTSGVRDAGPKTKIEDLYVERVSNFMKPSDCSQSRQSCAMSSKTSKQSTQNTSAAEDGYHCKEISINARWGSGMRDQTSQTEELWSFQLSVKTFESKTKSQGTSPRHSERGLQTVYYHSMTPSHERSEFINIKIPQASYVKDHYPDSDDSDKVEKIWMGKSHSDSNLFEKGKCDCKSDTDKDSKGTGKECPPAAKTSSNKTQKSGAPVADLSELKTYIRELFEKENFAYKKCQCDKPAKKNPPVDYKSTQTCDTRKESADAEVQTPRFEKSKHAEVQTTKSLNSDKKKNEEAQTDVCVFLDESEGDPRLPKKVKVCRTAILDPEDNSKTFFICTVCGREITVISKNVTTSTVDLRSAPFIKTPRKNVTNENEVTKWTETQIEIKKVRKPSKMCQKVTPQNEKEKITEKPSKTSKPSRSNQKNLAQSSVHSRCDPEFSDQGTSTSATKQKDCDCKCECTHTPGTSDAKSHSRSQHGVSVSTKQSRGKVTHSACHNGVEFFYPVITSRKWPKEFLQNWESLESCMQSSKNTEDTDSKNQHAKQKRTYDKEVESSALGKRIKVEVEEKPSFPNPSPTVSGVLIKAEDGGYKFWPSSFVECPAFPSKNDILDENEVGESLSTLQLDDILQDDFLASTQTSDDVNTSRSSLLTENEEHECEPAAEVANVPPLPNRPKVMPQSHSVFNFNSFSKAKVSSNSKSLNSFGFIGGTKKKSERI